ncbi:MAG TPA: hypothetical protein VH372_18455 [Actinospica sp.]|nr:hypothetical protein [Actinospica sp.]
MSIIVEYFTAPDDAAAADVLYGGPESVYPTLSCGNFLADIAMTEWEVLLLGRLGAAPPRVVAGHEPSGIARVFAASAALQTALAAAGREALERLARHWLEEYADDVSGMAPDTARELLWELAELAREAKALRQALYCWMC